ncbi:family 20 glycosylhydrolase [Elizabethkingia meningoseptica]|uniref:glycoside hydrolase family 20 protein n=1 Tax=Elizabethkingia meningoseptica TaxID=238 RepID=UPI0023B17439|nr:family 20 glycosylhydrolase [Elizabethkingia meningoseptica]MDE5466692.1 family 20 glycosylhydrolase [Elizabethkingia meningoseptica]MDE5474078.1 family 20 glycosylhydrolase [Elizabethkingia meningoseptica]MDE5477511.1 family 20 glycosylhydrolase [Elizabethkingia meningoseptica]MDE5484011.1 family 20 glycosylhydrolase [Elizabethkingia meningoseptica]MDE5500910.1 family 20 glycosylhydrolase [Elizabethkingia meningoseptica]
MKKLNSMILVAALSVGTAAYGQNAIIPKPQKISVQQTNYNFGKGISIQASKAIPEAAYLQKQLKSITGKDYKMGPKANVTFTLLKKDARQKEGFYTLKIDDKGVNIAGYDNQGLFYGVQTFLQLVEEHKNDLQIPYMEIEDYPKFAYRGMMLDVSRHFFTAEEVKNYLDYLAAYKYNKFHWHLTDDQGWRIEIKKYPKLTEVGAWREGSQVGRYVDMKFDDKRYGGFYTQEQVKDVVAYAKKLHIDIIPEIEMPGHAQAALAAYPNLACTEGPFKVGKTWGVMEDIFCPKEETFKFLEGVIDEVIPLFPYKYIHIGGDEAPKKRWKESQFAQDLIKKLNLKDELHLQSYFITRMEKYINSKGKQIIGWDEILEGGLAPNATVMSWTGIEGGIHAAKTGHKAIMTPTSTNYFDYYQGSPDTEPIAIGGDLRLPKVYAYNPIPKELTPEQAKYIWGTQGNLWTEYILDFKHVQHMIFPRMMALAEVAWGTSNPEEYKNFEARVIQHFKTLDRKGIDYSTAIYEVDGKATAKDGQVFYNLTSANQPENIRYTIDGSEPTMQSNVYSKPINVDKTMTVKSAYFENGKKVSATTVQDFLITKSTGKKITLEKQPSEAYSTGGAGALVDGIRGNAKNHGKSWLGFSGKDVVATIDFGNKTDFSTVQFSTLERPGSWIYWPSAAKVYVSDNGTDFKEVKSIDAAAIQQSNGVVSLSFPKQNARFIKVEIKNLGKIADGKSGAGNDAWLFVDEIAVN